jgi:hypothetical protein
MTALLALVRVLLHKKTGGTKLPDADNVKGGALAATMCA